MFKLVGFYPNAVGGVMNLEVNLDGQGAAERTGTLWARDFHVLGDPVVIEVLQNADSNPQPSSAADVVREKFEFEIMRVPFSVGHGQFVMHNAAIKGPLVSATPARQGRLQGAGHRRRRHLRAALRLKQVMASIPAARPDPDRAARGGRVRHHLRHQGRRGEPAAGRQSVSRCSRPASSARSSR